MLSFERPHPRHHLVTLLLAGLALTTSGCALSNTQTARQLDPGEFILGGSLDMPGYLFLPRASLQATYGYGYGDISARAGSALLSNFVGVGARFYPADWLNISADADLMLLLLPLSNSLDGWMPALNLTPRISTTTSEDRFFYGGVQSNLLFLDPIQLTGESNSSVALFGGFLGAEWRSTSGFGIQTELVLSPLAYNMTYGHFIAPLFEPGEELSGFLEFSIGFYWSNRSQKKTQQYIPPTSEQGPKREPAPEPEPYRNRRPEKERQTPPLYDEDDVPLY